MANAHLQGDAGNDSGTDGLSWAQSKATAVAAASVAGAGGTIYADAAQSESNTSSINFSLGTVSAPGQFISGTPDASTGLTDDDQGYTINMTGGTFTAKFDGFFHAEGVNVDVGSGSLNCSIALAQVSDNRQRWKRGNFILDGSTSSGSRIYVGSASSVSASHVTWDDRWVRFAHQSQGIFVRNATLEWNGGGVLAGGSTPSGLFLGGTSAGHPSIIRCTGVDFSNLASTFHFISNPAGGGRLVLRGCWLPNAWAGDLIFGTNLRNWRAEMYDCDSGASNAYTRFWIKDHFGSATQETSIDRTGDGDARADYSIKVVTGADASYPSQPFIVYEQAIHNSTTGSQKTLTVELASNDTLSNKDVVFRARYPSEAASPLMGEVTNEPSVIASPTTLATSTVSWNNQPTNRYKIALTFTPQRAGDILYDLLVYRPDTTVYIAGVTLA